MLAPLLGLNLTAGAAQFDAASFALPLPEGTGLLWEDPREIHRVVVTFADKAPDPGTVRLQYWGSRWPKQHLPKDREPGGADVGWMELGNWYNGGWREADADVSTVGNTTVFQFHPVNRKEFPGLKDYEATFRYTLKVKITGDAPLPPVQRIQAFTDSTVVTDTFRLVWDKGSGLPQFEVFNGSIHEVKEDGPRACIVTLAATRNPDPNTFDKTLVTVRTEKWTFTFGLRDLSEGPLVVSHAACAVLPASDLRSYAAATRAGTPVRAKSLYDRVTELPEQTWSKAWAGIPRKKSDIYLPLGLDGGRQRFRLDPDGSVRWRLNDHFMRTRPGRDTALLQRESGDLRLAFAQPPRPAWRTLEEGSLPICVTSWETNGVRTTQTAFVTELGGTRTGLLPPAADSIAVAMLKFVLTNLSDEPRTAKLPLACRAGDSTVQLTWDPAGLLRANGRCRAGVFPPIAPTNEGDELKWDWTLKPREGRELVLKVPFLALEGPEEEHALSALDFGSQHTAVADFWRRRLDQSARLITPEPMLNEFYRAHAAHLLINCEGEPGAARRFARVGSFNYAAFGNESCMMVLDLDRRGFHREAEECLEAWLHYQGTVPLPGDFSSRGGVLYGAGGYEHGGYNQHHGWILWMMVEHYRFTLDEQWLRHALPGILAGADWIIRETDRTSGRHELERGLLPAGSLEDIGDWWTWLSTSCYTWRGLDSAGWALEQAKHPDAARVRAAAKQYHERLLANFKKASERSPVVRLRDGSAVPQIPSQAHRRGRSFGWICQTLEGSLHLLITRALDPRSPEAGWIVRDYEDNLYLSNQYGYTVPDFERYWFDRGGMSMQACLLLGVEPYLFRDDVKHALRALFNAQAVSYFPDVRMNTEHAAPYFDDWRGDHFKSSDESNCAGWLRQLFVREEGDELWLGQAIPREWLAQGKTCGVERTATWFGPASVIYKSEGAAITAMVNGPTRNPPAKIRVRFRHPESRVLSKVTVNGKPWRKFSGEWVELPGDVGAARVAATWSR